MLGFMTVLFWGILMITLLSVCVCFEIEIRVEVVVDD